ncbi:MAG: hypothetical protein M3126_08545, partial [Candidatus Eremiobacteraeota bacterium]|nr:hypothetical protein [Candidatus Eremiobacteraeota bacterium]
SGPATGLAAPHQIDFDKAGYMYVANYGFSSYGGTIGIFAPNATGNTAPVRTITGINAAAGVAIGP